MTVKLSEIDFLTLSPTILYCLMHTAPYPIITSFLKIHSLLH